MSCAIATSRIGCGAPKADSHKPPTGMKNLTIFFENHLLRRRSVRYSMNDDQLETECRRTADDFVSLDWGLSKSRIMSAVHEVVSGSNLYNLALEFLLEETTKLPPNFEPARRLKDLVDASAALRSKRKRVSLWDVAA